MGRLRFSAEGLTPGPSQLPVVSHLPGNDPVGETLVVSRSRA